MKYAIVMAVLIYSVPCFSLQPDVDLEPDVEPEATSMNDGATSVGDFRSKTSDWMISPQKTANISLQLESITSSDDLTMVTGDADLKLTDVAMLRLLANYAMAKRAQFFIHAALLPKQTVNMDENVFQNAGLRLRIGIAEHFAASLFVSGGATSRRDIWTSGGLALESRWSLNRYIRIDLSAGASGLTILGNDYADFIETGASMQIGAGDKYFGGWLGAAYNVPVWDGGVHEPRNRLDLEIGAALTSLEYWISMWSTVWTTAEMSKNCCRCSQF